MSEEREGLRPAPFSLVSGFIAPTPWPNGVSAENTCPANAAPYDRNDRIGAHKQKRPLLMSGRFAFF
jgi:hypothetical protein